MTDEQRQKLRPVSICGNQSDLWWFHSWTISNNEPRAIVENRYGIVDMYPPNSVRFMDYEGIKRNAQESDD